MIAIEGKIKELRLKAKNVKGIKNKLYYLDKALVLEQQLIKEIRNA